MVSNYPDGWAGGVVMRGTPIDIPNPGEVFWVNNSGVLAKGGISASNGNKGSYLEPFKTLDYAIGQCTADRGDIIYIMPGHSETFIADSSIDFDVNGITVIGLGRGSLRPQFNFNHADATIELNADNVGLYNLRFTSTITVVAIGLSVITGATNSVISGCVFDIDSSNDEFLIAINYGVGCNNLLVEDCVIDMGLYGAAAGIKLVGATAGGDIRRNRIVGNYSLANIAGSVTASTEIYIDDNLLFNGGSGAVGTNPVVSMNGSTTGVVRRNTQFCNVANMDDMWVSAAQGFSENWGGENMGAAAGNKFCVDATAVVGSADG